MTELLAPAGDFESLKAAVLNGADAVYIGGKEFSARQSAANFDRDEIVSAVRFCHSYGAKVYITLNTLLNDDELEKALNYAGFLYETGVDALIIQDLGLLKSLREYIPEFELHASTQMTAHNLDAVNYLHSLGVKRVVLSRELSLDEISYITKNAEAEAETEVFIHGALCISFSGQCLMSSMIGKRSGNRGRCAQPCRKEYSIDGSKYAYYLSPRDLSALEFINKIKDTGAASLKIEGRMKKPEYVATIVSAYRKALDGKMTGCDVDDVMQIFNRGGFTSDFMFKRQGKNMMCYDSPKNRGTYIGYVTSESGKFAEVKLSAPLSVGDGVEVFGKNIGAPVGSIKLNKTDVKSANPGSVVLIYLDGAKKGDKIYKTFDMDLNERARKSFTGNDIKRVPLTAKFEAHKGSKIKLTAFKNGITVEEEGIEPEMALKVPTTDDKIISSLSKTKDTPFYFKSIDIDMDNDIAIPVSHLNAIRRGAIEKLIDRLQGKRERIDIKYDSYKKDEAPEISVAERINDRKTAVDAGYNKDKMKNANLKELDLAAIDAGYNKYKTKNADLKILDLTDIDEGYNKYKIPKVVAAAGRIDAAKAAVDAGCKIVFFGGDALRINNGSIDEVISYAGDKAKVYPWYPEIMLDNYEKYKAEALNLKGNGIDAALCGNMGFYSYLKSIGYKVFLNKGFNLFNSKACDLFYDDVCVLSPELDMKNIRDVIAKTKAETALTVYGKIKVMTSRQCIVGSAKGGGGENCKNLCENKIHYIKDKMGEVFPLITDTNCKTHIYNSKTTCVIEEMPKILKLNCDYLLLDFVDETADDVKLVADAYIDAVHSAENGKTSRMALKLMEYLKGKTTKGHFNRGVE